VLPLIDARGHQHVQTDGRQMICFVLQRVSIDGLYTVTWPQADPFRWAARSDLHYLEPCFVAKTTQTPDWSISMHNWHESGNGDE
jgi:hypothetical protein